MPREPQSYGSQGGWVSGKVDEEVNRQKDVPASHPHFYECRRDSEESGSDQGGKVSRFQAEESAGWYPQASDSGTESVQRISAQKKGAKRGSFFKDRDYRR